MSVLQTPSMPLPTLEKKLHTTARVRMLSWLCVGLALAVAAVITAFSVYSLIDLGWHLSPFGRSVAVLATGGMGLAMLAIGLAQAWRQSRDLNREALAVQQANPQLGNALSASLLYGADAELTRRESSPAIVDRLVHTTASTAERATFSRAVSWRTPKIYALIALALLLVALVAAQMNLRIFSLTWQRFVNPWADIPAPTWTALGAIGPYGDAENRWQVPAGAAVTVTAEVLEHDPGEAFIETRTANSDWLRRAMYKLPAGAQDAGAARYGYDFDNLLTDVQYRVICGDAESARYAIPVSIEPQLADLEVIVTPPAFLRRPPTVLRGIGDIDALIGSTVEVRARANKKLQRCEVALRPEGQVSCGPQVASHIGLIPFYTALDAARAEAAQHPGAAADVPIGSTDHDLVAHFTVTDSGSYGIYFTDFDGKDNKDELRYSIRARSNNPAKVKITAPGKDVSVKTTAKVAIDMTAEDDFSLREVGLYLMVGRSIERKTLKRPAPGDAAVRTSYDLELGHHTFQGGEVITYWAFAVDEDGSENGREVTSEPQFMMTYAENNFEQDPPPQPPSMSPQDKKATLGLDQLIEDQKTEVKDTFALHMQMGLSFNRAAFAKAAGADGPAQPATDTVKAELPPATEIKPEHASRATTLAATQSRIQTDLRQLIADVKVELAKLQAEQQRQSNAPQPGTPDGPGQPGGGGPGQPQNGIGLKELALLEEAVAKMDEVQPPLQAVRPDSAVQPENEALRLMSEARKLILSKNGSGQMKIALDSAQRKKQQRQQQQQDQQAQQTAEQMRKLPPLLEDMEDLQEEAKKLEKRLNEQPPQQQQAQAQPQDNPASTPEQQKAEENRRLANQQQEQENRRLANRMKEQAQELADRAKETADRLREMNKENLGDKEAQRQRDQAAEKLEQTARKLAKAGEQADQAQKPQDAKQAQQDLADAQQAVKDAADKLDQSLQAQNNQRLNQAVKDAQEMEQRQQQLAQDTHALQQTADGKPQTEKQNQAANPDNPQAQDQTTPQTGEQPQTAPQQQPTADQQPNGPAAEQKQTADRDNLASRQKALENDLTNLRERLKELADQLDRNQPAGSPQQQAADALNEAAKKAETRSDLQRDLANAAKELQTGDLNRAREKQQAAAQGMRDLRQELEQAQAHTAGAARDELNRTLDQLAELHRQIDQAKQAAADPKQAQLAPPTDALADRAAQTARQVEDLAAADRQTRRDAAAKLQRAAQALDQPATPAPAERQGQLDTAQKEVAAAARELERALQQLDRNQVRKTQTLVDQALNAQQAANQAMQTAEQAKTDQAAREADNAARPQGGSDLEKQAAADRAGQAADAAQRAAARQTQAAAGAREIEEALRKLQTYLSGGQDPTSPTPPPAGDTQPRKLAQAAADRFAAEKIPAATQTLADKIAELRDKQTPPAAETTAPAAPPAAIPPKAAAAKWQEHHTAGAAIETNLADVKQRLEQLQAAIDQDELKRLEAARQAVAAMERKLAPQPDPNPAGATAEPKPTDPQPPTGAAPLPLTADDLKQMNKDIEQLKGDLGRLHLDEKTLAALDQAGKELNQALQQPAPHGQPRPQANPQSDAQPSAPTQPQPGDRPDGQPQPSGTAPANGQTPRQSGEQPTFADRPGARAGRNQLKFVRGGLESAIERVLADRKIGNENADSAPRVYDALVDKYFETLSDEQIEKRNRAGADR